MSERRYGRREAVRGEIALTAAGGDFDFDFDFGDHMHSPFSRVSLIEAKDKTSKPIGGTCALSCD